MNRMEHLQFLLADEMAKRERAEALASANWATVEKTRVQRNMAEERAERAEAERDLNQGMIDAEREETEAWKAEVERLREELKAVDDEISTRLRSTRRQLRRGLIAKNKQLEGLVAEVERLSFQVGEMRMIAVNERDLADRLAEALMEELEYDPERMVDNAALAAWKEARRG